MMTPGKTGPMPTWVRPSSTGPGRARVSFTIQSRQAELLEDNAAGDDDFDGSRLFATQLTGQNVNACILSSHHGLECVESPAPICVMMAGTCDLAGTKLCGDGCDSRPSHLEVDPQAQPYSGAPMSKRT